MIIPVEVWKKVPNFEDYEVSSFGNVRSYRPRCGKGPSLSTPRPVKPTLIKNKPYYQLTLCDGVGGYKQVRLHMLILEVFIGPRPTKEHECCHNDGNPNNNFLENLRWGTKKENMLDQYKHGTRILGEKSPNAVLTEEQVMILKNALPDWKHGMGTKFAKQFGVGTSTISRVKKGISWGHV